MGIGLDEAKWRLRRFAEVEAGEASPLYAHLADSAADDDEIAGLLTAVPEQEAKPNLLLATVHRMVQAEPLHPLSRYYPSLGGSDGVDRETWPLLREFLLARAASAREIMSTRCTQTNEVRRAALLYPAVAMAAKQARGTIGLLELGCSAGLLLGLDRYSYRYQCDGGEQLTAGPAKAPVGLHCALRLADGASLPTLAKKVTVGARVGVDRAPVDASDEDELAWLEACVWADQPDRIRLLRTAADAQRKAPPELVTGDAVDDLATAAERIPAEQGLVVLSSHLLAYLDERRRRDFVAALGELATKRPLWWVSQETYEAGLRYVLPDREDLVGQGDKELCTLGLVRFADRTPQAAALARTDPHGQRMTWLP